MKSLSSRPESARRSPSCFGKLSRTVAPFMKIIVFSTKRYDREFLEAANSGHITGHRVFFTRNALEQIASVTTGNLTEFEESGRCGDHVKAAA